MYDDVRDMRILIDIVQEYRIEELGVDLGIELGEGWKVHIVVGWTNESK